MWKKYINSNIKLKSLLFRLKQRQAFRWSTRCLRWFSCGVTFCWFEIFLIKQRLYCQDLWLLREREDRNEWIASKWVSCFFFFSLFKQHKINGVQTFRNLRNLIWCQNYLREYFISGFRMLIKENISYSYFMFPACCTVARC